MVNSIEDIIELHKSSGNIEDAYIKIHIDDKIMNLNTFTMRITAVDATKEDLNIWNNRINKEIKKNRELEKEIKEFYSVFELLNKVKIRSGKLVKSECPDFILEKNGVTIGIEVTKIYSGPEWLVDELEAEIEEYKIDSDEVDGYLVHKKASQKVEYDKKTHEVKFGEKSFPMETEEYDIKIKNKILEKIRKQIDDYKKCDINVVYANIMSPEFFYAITDLDSFTKEISYYIAHLEANMDIADYRLVIRINSTWIEINLNTGTYEII